MRRTLLICSVLLAGHASASAAGLPLDGAYGSKEGCIYAKTGDSSGADNFFLLTKEALTTSTASCDVKSVGKTTGDTTSLIFSCQAEGEEKPGDVKGKLTRIGKDSIKVTMEDGSAWGPYKKCR